MTDDNVRVTATDRNGQRLRQLTVINHQKVVGNAKTELQTQFPDAYIFVNYHTPTVDYGGVVRNFHRRAN